MPDSHDELSSHSGRELHLRLLDNDPTAPADLALAFLDRLIDWLSGRFPSVDPDIRTTAAEDALLSLMRSPVSYKPERQTLEAYLRLAASGDLKNLLRAERRHGRRRADLEAVALSPDMGKYLWDVDADPALVLERLDAVAARLSTLPEGVREGLSDVEERVLQLMRVGERRTMVYAAVMGIADQPPDARRQAVRRIKDKLKKRLERSGAGR